MAMGIATAFQIFLNKNLWRRDWAVDIVHAKNVSWARIDA